MILTPPKACVVNVTQLRTVDRVRLERKLGTLGPTRIRDVLRGLSLVLGTDALEEPGSLE